MKSIDSILNCYLLKEKHFFTANYCRKCKTMRLHEAKYWRCKKLQFWKLNALKNATLSPLKKYANYCDEIICTNQSEGRHLIKYGRKESSFELDMQNVEISQLRKFRQNATNYRGVIALKCMVGRTDSPILISPVFLQKAEDKNISIK